MVICRGRGEIVFVSAPQTNTEILREMHPWMKSRIKRRNHCKLLPSVLHTVKAPDEVQLLLPVSSTGTVPKHFWVIISTARAVAGSENEVG